MKILLTDRFLRAIKPASKRQIIYDTAVPGNAAATGRADTADMAARTVPCHDTRRRPLRRAGSLAGHCGGDRSGKEERSRSAALERRRANTFAVVAEDFIGRHVSKLRSASDVESTIRRELIPRWGARPITDLTRRDIIEAVEEIADSGRLHTAHNSYSYISKIFSWTVARGTYGLEMSPCAALKRSAIITPRKPRQRVLNSAELRAVWNAAEGLGYPLSPFVRLLLLTGQRLNEVAQMLWAELDLDKALWIIPPERMKCDAAHEVPLSPIAIKILRSLPRWSGPFVFSTTAGARPISGFSKMKLRIDAAMPAPITPWRFHDLRRTMRTGLSALPIPNNVAELCIAQPGLHRVYDQHSYRDEKRQAFELWADRLMSIVNPPEDDGVIQMSAARRR
jgi:integrase